MRKLTSFFMGVFCFFLFTNYAANELSTLDFHIQLKDFKSKNVYVDMYVKNFKGTILEVCQYSTPDGEIYKDISNLKVVGANNKDLKYTYNKENRCWLVNTAGEKN